jgi:hypothetical protein
VASGGRGRLPPTESRREEGKERGGSWREGEGLRREERERE